MLYGISLWTKLFNTIGTSNMAKNSPRPKVEASSRTISSHGKFMWCVIRTTNFMEATSLVQQGRVIPLEYLRKLLLKSLIQPKVTTKACPWLKLKHCLPKAKPSTKKTQEEWKRVSVAWNCSTKIRQAITNYWTTKAKNLMRALKKKSSFSLAREISKGMYLSCQKIQTTLSAERTSRTI